MHIYIHTYTHIYMTEWLECSSKAQEAWVQSHVESCQRLKKWYLMLPCLTLSITRYGSRLKQVIPGKGVAPFPTCWWSSYRKGSLLVTLDYSRQLHLLYICMSCLNFGWNEFSLSFIASGRSSGLHPISSHSCCMYVRAGRPAFAWPYAGGP